MQIQPIAPKWARKRRCKFSSSKSNRNKCGWNPTRNTTSPFRVVTCGECALVCGCAEREAAVHAPCKQRQTTGRVRTHTRPITHARAEAAKSLAEHRQCTSQPPTHPCTMRIATVLASVSILTAPLGTSGLGIKEWQRPTTIHSVQREP